MLWILIKTGIAIASLYYIGALIAVVTYESKLERMYRAKNEALESIRKMPVSMAVIGAKTFKIEQDYKVHTDILYKRQREILKILPFFRQAFL